MSEVEPRTCCSMVNMWYSVKNQRNEPKGIKNQNTFTMEKVAVEGIVKYSEKELNEFRSIILEKLANAKAEHAIQMKGIVDEDDVFSKEVMNGLAAKQGKFIASLENALNRIKNGTYGICSVTGKLIPKERLNSVPHATLSVQAKNAQKKPSVNGPVARSFMSTLAAE